MSDRPSESSEAARALARAGQQTGTLVSFSGEDRAGWIESDDGDLYFFSAADIVSLRDIPVGSNVRFCGAEGLATEVDHAVAGNTQPDMTPEKAAFATASQSQPATAEAPPAAKSDPDPEPGGLRPADAAAKASPPSVPKAQVTTPRRVAQSAQPIPSSRGEDSSPKTPATAANSDAESRAPARETLKGQLVSYETEGSSGWIQGENSKLYGFRKGDALDPMTLVIGQGVLFHSFDNVTATCVVSVAKGEDPQAAMAAAKAAARAQELEQQKKRRRPRPRPQPAPATGGEGFLARHGAKFGIAGSLLLAVALIALAWNRWGPSEIGTQPTQVASAPTRSPVTPAPAAPAQDGATERQPSDSTEPESAQRLPDPAPTETAESDFEPSPEPTIDATPNVAPTPSVKTPDLRPAARTDSNDPPATSAPQSPPAPAGTLVRADLPQPEALAAETTKVLPAPTPTAPAADATPQPAEPEAPAQASSPVLTGADLPLPRAPAKGEALTAWWQTQIPGNLNVNFAGHLSSRPAIVLAFDGIFTGNEGFDTFISVTDSAGEPMLGRWEVGPNRTSLILAVPPGRYYVSIGAGLRDNRGRSLGRRLGGVLRIL